MQAKPALPILMDLPDRPLSVSLSEAYLVKYFENNVRKSAIAHLTSEDFRIARHQNPKKSLI